MLELQKINIIYSKGQQKVVSENFFISNNVDIVYNNDYRNHAVHVPRIIDNNNIMCSAQN